MKPQRFEEHLGTVRIRHHWVPKKTSRVPGWQAVFFAVMFVGFGSAMILASFGLLPRSSPPRPDSSEWGWMFVGPSFLMIGLVAAVIAFRGHKEQNRLRNAQPDDLPETKDHVWDRERFEVSGWRTVVEAAVSVIFISMFLFPFNWFCFSEHGEFRTNVLAKIAVAVFDVAGALCWFHFFKRLLHQRKFGATRVEFARFPFRVGEPVALRFVPPQSVKAMNSASFMLRCVEEWLERTERRDPTAGRIVWSAHWNGTWHLDDASAFFRGEVIELTFDPPADLPPTSLSTPRQVFWELIVKLDVDGLDFEEVYLVPIY